MRKAASIASITLLTATLSVQNVFASSQSSVHVESNGNASATVNVQSNFNSSNTSTTTNTSNTKIRIESDGEVKEYESTNGDDIHMESSDGNSKVTVKTGGVKVDNEDHNATIEAKDIKKEEEKMEKDMDELKEKQRNFFEKITEAIKDFFRNLF